MGKREFTHKFLNPTTNISYLEREYNIIEHMILHYDKYDPFLKQQLKDIKDLSKWERQIFIKKITPKTFYNLHKNIIYQVQTTTINTLIPFAHRLT
jgi:DNA mismatch repair ATPase MutS